MVLGPASDPTGEPRDSSARSGAPRGADHEDLKKAAESALRTARTLGEVAVTVLDKSVVPPARVTVKLGARTAVVVAKWILI